VLYRKAKGGVDADEFLEETAVKKQPVGECAFFERAQCPGLGAQAFNLGTETALAEAGVVGLQEARPPVFKGFTDGWEPAVAIDLVNSVPDKVGCVGAIDAASEEARTGVGVLGMCWQCQNQCGK
jgi:hypothetical protein